MKFESIVVTCDCGFTTYFSREDRKVKHCFSCRRDIRLRFSEKENTLAVFASRVRR